MSLPVNEIFSTIQGEGSFTGTPAVFVRLQHCPVGCPWCFVPATPILMGDGKYKRIDSIKLGDIVMSWTGEGFEPQPVTELYKSQASELVKISTDASENRKIVCTPEHPILTTTGWVNAGNLKIGDVLVKWDVSARMHSQLNPQRVKPNRPSKEAIVRLSKNMSDRWVNDPSVRQGSVNRMLINNPMKDPAIAAKSWTSREARRKTKLEQLVERVCDGLPIVYCGDGKDFSVAHKFPDFRVEGKKKLIEVWASDAPWAELAKRDDNWVDRRRKLFAKHGYETLFLPLGYNDIRKPNWPVIREQVARFIHNGTVVTAVSKVGTKGLARIYGKASATKIVYNLEVEKNHTYVADGFVVHNCDTKHTWSKDLDKQISFEEMLIKTVDAPAWADVPEYALIDFLMKQPEKLIVITGGEPCMYDLNELTSHLITKGKWCQIETSGTSEVKTDPTTFVTVSPKLDMPGGLPFLRSALYRADEIKMPVGKLADVDKLKELLRDISGIPVFLQPLSQSEKATQLCIELARLNGWRLSAQLHKFIGVR